MAGDFQLDPAFLKKIEKSEGVHRVLVKAAEAGAAAARLYVPVDSGELLASIQVQENPDGTVDYVATADHAVHVEFGTRDTPAQPFLRPAISAVKKALS